MKYAKTLIGYLIIFCLLITAAGCVEAEQQPDSSIAGGNSAISATGEKILYAAFNFAHPSLDTHKEYFGWYTSIYGISETLFKVADDSSIQPWLAKSGSSEDGRAWTVVLKDDVCFSNGDPLTADMVIRNLKRVGDVHSRFDYLSRFTYEVLDDKTFTIISENTFPTMLNVLASCELGILNLDAITDFENAIIATGPFAIDTFEPSGTVTVVRNDNYWGGDVALDGAVIYKIAEDDALLMAMQNGEIDCYTGVDAAAAEIYRAIPDSYNLITVATPRVQFYILNQNTLSSNIRRAINLAIDVDQLVAYMGGTAIATDGPFSDITPYGQVSKPALDTDAATSLLEKDGYTRNSDGYFEKDDEVLTVNLAYYPFRSLDTLAPLIQKQLRDIGIQAILTSEESPDDTYIANADFDIGLYSMNGDIYGDPEYFISHVFKDTGYLNVGGFDSAECQELIDQLNSEMDVSKRADLANRIVQIAIDDDAYGFMTLFTKTTVFRTGAQGFAENSPFDFYGLDATSNVG